MNWVHLLPIFIAAIIPFTFFTTYAIAVGLKHVEPDFPYISDTGTTPPESCIFGQLLNMSAVLIGLTCYIRYKQIEDSCNHSVALRRGNKVTFFLGVLSAFGISLVGNFQETSILVVHTIGALIAFGFGVIYAWISTVMSFKMYPSITHKCTSYVRLVICVISTIAFVLTFVFAALAKENYHGKNPRKWFPEDGGFDWHIASTAMEWTLAGAFIMYFLTFVPEFRQVTVTGPQITFNPYQQTNTGIYSTDYIDDDEPIIT